MGVIGEMALWGSATPPVNWLLTDQAVSRTTYADLYGVIGTTFGPGDGSTTFDLPKAAGRAIVIAGSGSGLTPRSLADQWGEETHQLTTAELAVHDHAAKSAYGGSGTSSLPVLTLNQSNNAPVLTAASGSGVAHNNCQPSIALRLIIRYALDDVVPPVVAWDSDQYDGLISALTE